MSARKRCKWHLRAIASPVAPFHVLGNPATGWVFPGGDSQPVNEGGESHYFATVEPLPAFTLVLCFLPLWRWV
jgi:hypothetical protein